MTYLKVTSRGNIIVSAHYHARRSTCTARMPMSGASEFRGEAPEERTLSEQSLGPRTLEIPFLLNSIDDLIDLVQCMDAFPLMEHFGIVRTEDRDLC